MNSIVRYGDIIAVAGGGITLAAASAAGDVSTGWWIAWGVCAAVTAAARIYRHRITRP
ncbi:hypothetical protein ACWF94_37470 [Streptomyces sp. NPDC055078]